MGTLTSWFGTIRVDYDAVMQRLIVGSVGAALSGGWLALAWIGVERSIDSGGAELTLFGLPHAFVYLTWLMVGISSLWATILVVVRDATQRYASGETVLDWELRLTRISRIWILLAMMFGVYGLGITFAFDMFGWHPWQITLSFEHRDILQLSLWHFTIAVPALCLGEAVWCIAQRALGPHRTDWGS